MYDFLRGAVVSVDTANRVSFEVGGVGYLLRVSALTRKAIPLDGKAVVVYVRLVVREDDLILFGFHDVAERVCFDLLTSVDKVGPVIAMSILGAMSPLMLRDTIAGKFVKNLSTIKGVGPKSAERIVIELGTKLDRIPVAAAPEGLTAISANFDEQKKQAAQGLVALGFQRAASVEAVNAVFAADPALTDASNILRAALARLR